MSICDALGMDHARIFVKSKEPKTVVRARRARRLARPTGAMLVACILVAIWQEPALAPAVHDGMQHVVVLAQDVTEGNDYVRAMLARLNGGVDVAGVPGVDPVTALLLRAQD